MDNWTHPKNTRLRMPPLTASSPSNEPIGRPVATGKVWVWRAGLTGSLGVVGCWGALQQTSIVVGMWNQSQAIDLLPELGVLLFLAVGSFLAWWLCLSCALAAICCCSSELEKDSNAVTTHPEQNLARGKNTLDGSWQHRALRRFALPFVTRAVLGLGGAAILGIGSATALPVSAPTVATTITSQVSTVTSTSLASPSYEPHSESSSEPSSAGSSHSGNFSELSQPEQRSQNTAATDLRPGGAPPAQHRNKLSQKPRAGKTIKRVRAARAPLDLRPTIDQNSSLPATQYQVEVQPGDSLWSIAAHLAGPQASDSQIAALWPQIFAQNPQIKDPNLIFPGQILNFTWEG